ncbi:MAG TPA: HlyD family efflux transporter periplasmic adaptor subunit, partial [Planctomycetaceae bacterium]|nr:HlyD family efflux transporter periplasmic adaptor subunit [Planctomycetaceae bacterium]
NLSFAVMFICSVNTVVMNANPLMKFDGYYMLSDLLEIPNLQQKSFQLFQTFFADVCLGMETREPHFMPQQRRWRFITYAIAVYLYRWMVSFGVLWFLYTFLKPYKLQALGAVLAVASLYTLLVHPLIQLVKFLRAPGRTVSVSKLRICLTLLVVAGLIAAVLCIPIPHRVTTVLTIEPHDFDSVFVTVPGTLEAVYVEPGEYVHKGDLLAELENESLRLELESLERQAHSLEAGMKTYLALDRPGERQQAEDALHETREQITQRREQIGRLQIRAPRSGIIIPCPERPETVLEEDSELPHWERSALHRENLGASFDTGTPLCMVGDEREMEALLIVDQSDIEFVRPKREVRIVLDAYSQTRYTGEIIEIAQRQLQAAPVQIGSAGGGELPTKTDKEGRERPLSSSYQARVLLPNPEGLLEPGLRGRAKIFCGTRTCWQWFYRYLARTFTFSL